MAWGRQGREAALVLAAIALDLYVYDSDRAWRWGGTVPIWLVPAAAILVYSTLLARWNRPREVFAVQWCYGLTGLLLPGYAPFAGIVVALHAAASTLPRRWSSSVLALTFIALSVDNYNSAAAHPANPLPLFVSLSLGWLAILTAIWLTGRRTHMMARRNELERLRHEQAATEAVHSERVELARELHDGLARSLNAMIYQARGANAVLSRAPHHLEPTYLAPVQECLARVEAAGVRSVDELRRLLEVLRRTYPGVGDADRAWSAPNLTGIPHLIAMARDGGLSVEVLVHGAAASVEPAVEAAAYRVIEEGLTNASKHSGSSSARVRVAMTWSEHSLLVEIRNPIVTRGQGTPRPPRSGFGVRGLRERVLLANGVLRAGPTEDRTEYVLHAALPLIAVPAAPIVEKSYE